MATDCCIMKPFVKSEITHLLLQLRYYFLQRRLNVANNMVLGVNARSQVRKMGSFVRTSP